MGTCVWWGWGGLLLFIAGEAFGALHSEMSCKPSFRSGYPHLTTNISKNKGKLDTEVVDSTEVKGEDRMRARSPTIVLQAVKWHCPSGVASLPSASLYRA